MSRRILLVALGGTIAMTDTGRGVMPTMTADDILAAAPGLDRLGVDLETVTFRNQPSASLSIPDLLALYELIGSREAYGVVVTQGTDTLEETAYALDLLHDGPSTLVVTGAMRNPTLAGADGPANVLAAVAVAASPDARALGCLVVASDEIHAARRVRKTHSTSVATFASPDGGPLGYVVEGVPRFVNRPARRSRSYPPAGYAAALSSSDDDRAGRMGPPEAHAQERPPPDARFLEARLPDDHAQERRSPDTTSRETRQPDDHAQQRRPPDAGSREAGPPDNPAQQRRSPDARSLEARRFDDHDLKGRSPDAGSQEAGPPDDHAGTAWLPRVGLYTATLGDDGALLEEFASNLDGLVIAAFGVGHVHWAWPERLSRIAARIPVVLASRTGAGSVLHGTYDYPGSEQDLLRRGLIPAGFLHPYKARLLLQFLLSRGAARDEITEAFEAEG